MANKDLKVGDLVEMRDKGDPKWSLGVVSSLNPLLVRFENGPTGFSWPEVRLRGGNQSALSMEDPDKAAIQSQARVHGVNKPPMTLEHWDPEDKVFWAKEGRKIAFYNLAVSTVALFLGFCIWTMWGGIAKQIIAAHKADSTVYSFGYTDKKEHGAATKLLGPIASISGATSRVVHSWAVNPCGGRNTNLGSIFFIMLAMFTGGFTLLNDNCSLWVLYIAAIFAGIGGGIFSSSVSNVSFFAPDRLQGTFLAIDAGFGNLGVGVQAQVVPRFAKFGACMAGGDPLKVTGTFGVCDTFPLGKKYAWNPLFFFAMFALSLVYPASKMNNIPKHGTNAPPADEDLRMLGKAWYNASTSDLRYFAVMQMIGYFSSFCVALLFFVTNPAVLPMPGLVILRAFLLSMVAGAICWMLVNGCFVIGGGHIKQRMRVQLDTELFQDINTTFMTALYIMTFGSFIGYANAFPTLITTVFKEDPANYAWMGATFGSLSRVVGGIIADFIGGAMLTQIATTVQTLATIIAGVIVRVAQGSEDTSDTFVPFVIFIVILFTATGVGNASTFKQMATLSRDDPERRGILLGWTAAIAAYGAFVIPTIFQAGIKGGFLDVCFYVFALYYIACGAINYIFYLREDAPFPC